MDDPICKSHASYMKVMCYSCPSYLQVLLLFCLFCFNGHLPEGSGYPIRDFASRQGTEQTFLLPYAESILTSPLPGNEPSTWLNTKQPRGPRQIGIQSAPRGTRVCALPLVEPQV